MEVHLHATTARSGILLGPPNSLPLNLETQAAGFWYDEQDPQCQIDGSCRLLEG